MVRLRNFQDTFETRKGSFIKPCMTEPLALNLFKHMHLFQLSFV